MVILVLLAFRKTARLTYDCAIVTETIHYQTYANDESTASVIFLVKRLPGPIGRERFGARPFPKGIDGRVFSVNWSSYELDAFEVRGIENGKQYVTYNVQIPLVPNAIQLQLTGAATEQKRLDSLLARLLGGLHGRTNWLDATPPPAFHQTSAYGWLLIAVSVLYFISVIVASFYVANRTPRGTLLLIGIGVFISALSMNPERTRELLLLKALISIAGITGSLLGLFDLVRSRPQDSAKIVTAEAIVTTQAIVPAEAIATTQAIATAQAIATTQAIATDESERFRSRKKRSLDNHQGVASLTIERT